MPTESYARDVVYYEFPIDDPVALEKHISKFRKDMFAVSKSGLVECLVQQHCNHAGLLKQLDALKTQNRQMQIKLLTRPPVDTDLAAQKAKVEALKGIVYSLIQVGGEMK